MAATHPVSDALPSRRSVRTPPRLAVALLLLSALLALAACKGPSAGAESGAIKVATRLAGEARPGNVPVVIEVSEGGAPVLGAKVEVEADMTHAGMAPAMATATEVGGGTYRADALVLGMAGDWVLSVKVTTTSGQRAVGELLTTVRTR